MQALGPDSWDFLQGQFSNDLRVEGALGRSVYGLWLNRKGRIVADGFVLRECDESFWIVSCHCEESRVYERLDDYLVMDEVELVGQAASSYGVALWGGAIEAVVAELGVELPLKGDWRGGAGVFAFWGERAGAAVLEVVFSGGDAADRLESVRAFVQDRGFSILAHDDLSRMAVEALKPRVGLEIGLEDLPQEVGLATVAISYEKGCYLGQEVMARIRSMGKVRKRLASVDLESAQWLGELPVSLIDQHGKKRGSLRALEKCDSGYMGIAIIALESGSSLCIEKSDTRVGVRGCL